MEWIANPHDADSPLVLCTSEAAEYLTVLCALWLALDHMFQGREADGAAHATGVNLHADATNGHIDLTWRSADGLAGAWAYTLRLPKLFADSLADPEGAGHFEQVIGLAVHCLVEDYDTHCEEESAVDSRQSLRPMNWGTPGRGAPDLSHPAYAVDMPKVPLDFTFSTDASPLPEEVIV